MVYGNSKERSILHWYHEYYPRLMEHWISVKYILFGFSYQASDYCELPFVTCLILLCITS